MDIKSQIKNLKIGSVWSWLKGVGHSATIKRIENGKVVYDLHGCFSLKAGLIDTIEDFLVNFKFDK